MITQDYVSFETAKFLKEKGFDEYCRFVYNAGVLRSVASLDCHWNEGYGELIEEKQNSDFGKYDNAISAPTLQMAMKWLREVYNLHCSVDYDYILGWYCQIVDTKKTIDGYDGQEMKIYHPEQDNGFKSYEEACEAGIKYCLKNLI